jgi:hypothetical protein
LSDIKITKAVRKISSSISIAKGALRRHWAPCPLKVKSKVPAGGDGWNDLRCTHEDVDKHFRGDQNVGILWGEPSGWAVDVDLDCDEAVSAAKYLLPETYIYGRETRPASHYIYQSIDCPSRKWHHNKAIIVEIRSTGSQTAWVGSTHPEGDKYEINHEVDTVEIDADELIAHCGQLAAAVILARSYPKGGARHDYVHAMAGALLRDGLDGELVLRLVNAVLASTTNEDDPSQRLRTAKNTIKANDKDGHTYGWRTLANWVDEDDVERIKDYLKPSRHAKAPDIVITDSRKSKLNGSTPPDEVRKAMPPIPSGLTADIAAWCAARAYVVGSEFDLAAALMCTALASGNRYVMQHWSTPLQPYIMLLAPTGAGKDGAKRSVYEFARRLELRNKVFQSFQSYHSMLDTMNDEPSIACWLWDEAARKLESAGRSPSSPDYQVITHLLDMYGKAAEGIPGMPGRSNPIPPIERPFFLTLALAQPDSMVNAITKAELATGFVARFLLIDTGDSKGSLRRERQDIFPSRIENYVRKFRDVRLPPSGFVQIGYETTRVFNRFEKFAERAHNSPDNAELWNRANQNALIVAGLLAVGRNTQKPVVTDELAEWSITLSERSVSAWRERLAVGASNDSSENAKLVKNIETKIRDVKSLAMRGNKERPKEARLMAAGLMPIHTLKRMVRFDRRRDVEEAIKLLIDAKVIKQGMKEEVHVVWYLTN